MKKVSKKTLISICIVLFLAVLTACSGNNSGNGEVPMVVTQVIPNGAIPNQSQPAVQNVPAVTAVPTPEVVQPDNSTIVQNAQNIVAYTTGNGFTCINCVFNTGGMGYVRGLNNPLAMVPPSNYHVVGIDSISVNESWRVGKASASIFPVLGKVWIYAMNESGRVAFWFPIEASKCSGGWASETPCALYLIPEGNPTWQLKACAMVGNRYFHTVNGYVGDDINSSTDLRPLPGSGYFFLNGWDAPHLDLELVEFVPGTYQTVCPITDFESTWNAGQIYGLDGQTENQSLGNQIFSSNSPNSTIIELDPNTYPLPVERISSIRIIDPYYSAYYSKGSGIGNMCIYGCTRNVDGVPCRLGQPYFDESVYEGNLNLTLNGRYYQSCAPIEFLSEGGVGATFRNVPESTDLMVCGTDRTSSTTLYHSGWKKHWLFSDNVVRTSGVDETVQISLGEHNFTNGNLQNEMFCPPVTP